MRKGYRLYEDEEFGYETQSESVDNETLFQQENDAIQQYIDGNVDPRLDKDPELIKHINEFDFDELNDYLYDRKFLDQMRRPTTDRILINGRPFFIKAWLSKEGDDEYGYYYEGYIHLIDIRTHCTWSFVDREVMSGYFESWEEGVYDMMVEDEETRSTKEDYYVNRKDFEE